MNSLNADIVVIGGGISGILAAVAAARTGQQVLLAERYGFLGGMLTAGGVGPMTIAMLLYNTVCAAEAQAGGLE